MRMHINRARDNSGYKDTTKIWNEQILEQKNKINFIIECFLGGIWEFTHDRLPKNSQ